MEQEVCHERRQFTREFKLEAVRLIKKRGVSYAQASADLGVHRPQATASILDSTMCEIGCRSNLIRRLSAAHVE
jgi:predicted DNA-binding protein (UPF0251 family)